MKNSLRNISRIVFVLYIGAICFLCLHNFNGVNLTKTHIMGFETDKVIHFTMFLPFMELIYLAWGKRFSSPIKCLGAILVLFIAGCILSALTELCQEWFTEVRVADVADFKADTVALMVGAAGVFLTELLRKR